MCFVAFPVVSALGLNHRLSGWQPSGVPGRCSTGPGEAEMSSSLFCPFHHCIGIARVACAGGRTNSHPSAAALLISVSRGSPMGAVTTLYSQTTAWMCGMAQPVANIARLHRATINLQMPAFRVEPDFFVADPFTHLKISGWFGCCPRWDSGGRGGGKYEDGGTSASYAEVQRPRFFDANCAN